jgi:Leucine-rich repeat (LRR) protein
VLWLHYNQISDLSPLAGLTNLQELYLHNNQVSDLSPLAGLTNLQELSLYWNQINDLSPLAGLTNLQELSLFCNQINDLSPLAGLTNLRLMDLEGNQISDISPLAGLTNLWYLDLGYNQISDISPLAGLTNLWYLDLVYNQISDISPLAGMTYLGVLYLYSNQINDLSPLAGLANLQELYLDSNQISDLSPLAGLTNLQELRLDGNPISYEAMLLSQSWSLPWSTLSYNPLSPCYPVPNRGTTNVLVNYPLSWQGNYENSPDVYYEVWLGISPDELVYQGYVTQMVNTMEHQYSFNITLQANTQYYWRVKAISATEQIWSGMWSFTTGEGYYQPVIAVTPTIIYQELTTAETSQIEITITNNGTAPLNWNSNIVLIRAEQKTGTHPCINKEVNIDKELNEGRENTAENRMRQSKEDRQMLRRDGKPVNPLSEYGIDEKTEIERMKAEKRYFDSVSRERMGADKSDRDSQFRMPDINLSPYSGTIEPNSSVTCILTFIAGNTPGTYNYELQLSSNDPVSPLITVPLEYVVNSPIAYIPDDNFRWAINDALGQPSNYYPTIEDLQGLTGTLYAWSRNIISIEGAQYLTNLQGLWLDSNQISDISPLAGLTNLQDLYLNWNQISDLSPLAGLTNLQYLDLYYNHISDLSPLAGLTNLLYLDLKINQISDISPLAGMTNLQELDLYINQISDIGPLAGMTNLQELDLGQNQISDLSPLAGLTNLEWLSLYSNQISDLSPLVGITNLHVLCLGSNKISDISPLAGLTNLEELLLESNPISYESMILAQSWALPWHSSTYNPLSPCYPVPSRNAVSVSVTCDLTWQGNYVNSPDVYYEVWLGISPDELIYQGVVTQMVNTMEHQYSFNLTLQAYTQYYWRVKAVSATEQIWSGMWSFTTGNYGAGNTSMLEPVPVTLAINALQNQVRLSWQRRRDEESYYVYWSENPYAEFPEGWNGPVNVTETSFTDTLSDKCFYRVFAVPNMRGEIENKQNTKPRAIMPKRGE